MAAWPKPAGGSGFPARCFAILPGMSDLPDSARCVVIGGGVGGTSIAYHLGLAGWDDVVLLEQHELSDGTTWHSAGFVGQLRSTITQTRMIMYSTELYARLGEETGPRPGLARRSAACGWPPRPSARPSWSAPRARRPPTGWSWTCCRRRRRRSGWGC